MDEDAVPAAASGRERARGSGGRDARGAGGGGGGSSERGGRVPGAGEARE